MPVHGRWYHLVSPHRDANKDSLPTVPALTTSYVQGMVSTPLLLHTVGEVLQRTVECFPDREALVFVEQGVRKTFQQFQRDVSLFSYILISPSRKFSWNFQNLDIYEGTNHL